LTGLLSSTSTWLERFVEEFCPFWLHYTQSKCGSKGVFGNWERVYSIYVETITDDTLSNLVQREGGDASMRAIAVEAMPGRVDSRVMTVSRKTTTEVQNARDIWACPSQCIGECGEEIGVCQHMQVACDAVAVGTANLLLTTDRGATWAAVAVDPFAADENIIVGACFPVDRDTTRWLVARDADAADNLEVAYSDDLGATWTMADVGTTNNEAVTGPQSLFVIDAEHMWICTDDGNVFFCSDGGVTWVDQSALTASGANPLNAIHFLDDSVGICVGDADTVILTVDGGTNWTAGTATGGGNGLTTVQLYPLGRGQQAIVGDDGGDFYITWDNTATWTTGVYAGSGVGAVNCIALSTDVTGLMVADSAAPVGTVYHTADGGRSWQALVTPTNVGLTSVMMCNETRGFATGLATGALAVILEISAQ
jgi:photosystem II stability/assembly factor-like uncharacterized protein